MKGGKKLPDGSTKNRKRVTFFLPHECVAQIRELMAATNLRAASNIVAMAIVRWHSTEPLVQSMKRSA